MLKFHFLNVENGDCTIIDHLEDGVRSVGLIDCNSTPRRTSPALEKLTELGVSELSFVCITHPDKDHFSGILDVLEHYVGKIGTFFTYPLASVLTDTKLLKRYLQQIAAITRRSDDEAFIAKHAELMKIIRHAYEEFHREKNWIEITGDWDRIGIVGFKGVELYGIMPPKKMRGQVVQLVMGNEPDQIKSLNNNEISSAITIKYAGKTVILGGDATDENWKWHRKFREKVGITVSSELVKLPHHGSRRDNSKDTLHDFFEHTPSGLAIISADGRRHPDPEIFPVLDDLHATRYCTNVCNISDRALKRIFRDSSLEPNLVHALNVYTDPSLSTPSPCKGDITVSISRTGDINVETQFETLCGCNIVSFAAA